MRREAQHREHLAPELLKKLLGGCALLLLLVLLLVRMNGDHEGCAVLLPGEDLDRHGLAMVAPKVHLGVGWGLGRCCFDRREHQSGQDSMPEKWT